MSDRKCATFGSDGINVDSGKAGRDKITDLIGEKFIDGKRVGGDIHTTVGEDGQVHNGGFTLNGILLKEK